MTRDGYHSHRLAMTWGGYTTSVAMIEMATTHIMGRWHEIVTTLPSCGWHEMAATTTSTKTSSFIVWRCQVKISVEWRTPWDRQPLSQVLTTACGGSWAFVLQLWAEGWGTLSNANIFKSRSRSLPVHENGTSLKVIIYAFRTKTSLYDKLWEKKLSMRVHKTNLLYTWCSCCPSVKDARGDPNYSKRLPMTDLRLALILVVLVITKFSLTPPRRSKRTSPRLSPPSIEQRNS